MDKKKTFTSITEETHFDILNKQKNNQTKKYIHQTHPQEITNLKRGGKKIYFLANILNMHEHKHMRN